jgi:2-oxo-3-(phosphooxy)propyl 3-oxoalkanoate synthase
MSGIVQAGDQTVPRHLVHRWSMHEVFLTSVTPVDRSRFEINLQWPRWHSTTGPQVPARLTSTLVLEGIRQIGIYLAHTAWDVDLEYAFIARVLGCRWLGSPPTKSRGPFVASATAELVEARPGRGPGSGLDLTVHLSTDGERFALGVGTLACASPRLYRRLRGPGAELRSDELACPPPSEVQPAVVARGDASQVVVSDMQINADTQTAAAHLRVDPAHPFYFDHPADHVPGSLILEAAQQLAATMLHGGRIVAITGHFQRYLELVDPISLAMRAPGCDRLEVLVTQLGAAAAVVEIETASPATPTLRAVPRDHALVPR